MSEENDQLDFEKFNTNFTEIINWVTLDVTIREIAEDNKTLIHDLSTYDSKTAVPILASLLTLPEYQSNCIRLEILVALAVVYCRGQKKAHITQARQWFYMIGKSQCVMGEDPAEDIFVSLLLGEQRDYRLLGGIWEGAGFNTQLIFDVIRTMPDEGIYGQIKKSVHALLIISDIVCENAGLHRYQLGSDERHSELSSNNIPGRDPLASRVTFAFADLKKYGIKRADINPFILQTQMRNTLANQKIGGSYLDRYPLIIQTNTQFVVALPSSLTVAIRNFVIENIIDNGLVEAFDEILANKYAQLFYETPLLGGPTHAPLDWNKLGEHRWANFHLEVDDGYYISFHLFLPSIQTHTEGGFKSTYHMEGMLHKAVQESIKYTLAHFSGKSEFKEGLVVLVGCNWGKSYVTQSFELSRPDWRFQSITADDLVRLSWLEDMSPNYFWRIQDGLDAVKKAGVQIRNLSGIMNLIGWVRSNNGHFVPHESFPEIEVSAARPFEIIPPTDLLREVRAAVDQRYDRHCSLDNTGTWHDVRRLFPGPFFYNKSSRHVYASINAVRSGAMTSIYEGAFCLWISVKAPHITNKGTQYRLFEMANEWLHRIGAILDVRAEIATATPILKVHIKFHDADPPEYAREKPKSENLASLCAIEAYEESNACKAVFKVGFLDGLLIAENVAERLFVRNISRAFLHLLGEENDSHEAKKIEAQVVQNNEARNIHFFHAQGFIDYVRDTLSNQLVAIDSVDDAAARIGLGWRVRERGDGNRLQGREACTEFLAKIVDVLVNEVVSELATFNRLSTLRLLIINCEKASVERDHWNRTSASLLGLHGQNPKSVSRIVEQMSKFAGASTASRVLIEIALCACPLEGGSKLSKIEMSKLIARAALIVQFGGLSNAIHYNVLAPEIKISPLGDILFRDEFGQLVVKPMLSQMIGDQFIENAPFQKKNYEEPEIIPNSEEIISDEFWEVWTNEMDFTPDEARNIIGALEDKAIRDHAAILELCQSTYYTLVCSNTTVTKKVAERFLSQFSLETRAKWEEPPDDFVLKDIYPWRFRRRLSFITRPILKTDDREDPLLIIAPHALRTSFVYVFDGAYSGRFEQSFFNTERMKDTWWGKAREGHSYNSAIAKKLSDAGWEIRENVGLPELLNRQLERNFGDIDVLAWRNNRNEVLVIECKDLSPARNYSEIAALLSDYQGIEVNGKADKLRKHLDRVSLLQENKLRLQHYTNLRELEIVSCLICNGIVPMQYAKVDALVNTYVGTIETILARRP